MPARTTLTPTADQALWDGLVDRFAGSTAFHRWNHLELTERIFGVRVDRLVVSVDGEPVGVWPVARRRFFMTASLPFPFLGPLVPDESLAATIVAFRRRQWRRGLIAADFDLQPGTSAGLIASVAGLRLREDATIVVDHADLDQLHAGYTKMRRRSLRRAEAAGATVRTAEPGEIAGLLPLVLEDAYGGRDVASPYPASTGEVVERWAAEHPEVQLLTALVHGEPAGVLVVLGGGPVVLSWLGGCLRRFRDAGPNALLYHEQLVLATESGAHRTDMIGTVDAGITAFKAAFGGQVVPYVRITSRLGPAPMWNLIHTLRRRPQAIPAQSVPDLATTEPALA